MNETRPAARALMACLGNHSRFRLVQALLGGARCVTDLASEVGLSQSCTTRHLQALEQRGVVRGTRDGKRVLYRIREDQPELEPLLGWALRAGAGGRPRSGGGRVAFRAAAQKPAPVQALPEPSAPEPRATVPPPGSPGSLDLAAAPAGRPRHASDLEDFLL